MTPAEARFLADARSAVLATVDPTGRPRLVPICFVVGTPATEIWSPIDEKPKRSTDPYRLARVRDIVERPSVSLLVERWDEDWTCLAWLRIHGRAEMVDPGPGTAASRPSAASGASAAAGRSAAIAVLRIKYPQYAEHRLETRPLIRIVATDVSSWGDL